MLSSPLSECISVYYAKCTVVLRLASFWMLLRRNANFFGQLKINMSPWTDDRVCCCTDSGFITSNHHVNECVWSVFRLWKNNAQIRQVQQFFQSFRCKSRSHFPQSCKSIQVSFLRECKKMRSQEATEKLGCFLWKRMTLKQRRNLLASKEDLKLFRSHHSTLLYRSALK